VGEIRAELKDPLGFVLEELRVSAGNEAVDVQVLDQMPESRAALE
jgi:hypothetical protein